MYANPPVHSGILDNGISPIRWLSNPFLYERQLGMACSPFSRVLKWDFCCKNGKSVPPVLMFNN